MQGQAEFKNEMLEALSGVIETYGLAVADTDAHGIILAGKDFAVDFGFTREGIEMAYLDLRPPPNRNHHPLGHYLVQVRHVPHPRFVWNKEGHPLLSLWRHELPWVVTTLEQHAQDILRGERGWMKDNPYTPYAAGEGMFKEALAAMEKHSSAP